MLTDTLFLATEPFNHWAPIGVLLVMGILFGVFNVVASHVLGPTRDGVLKGTVYESGMNPVGTAKRRFNVRFFMVAMTFLLFDVEIVFLYPWATVFPALGGSEGEPLAPLFLARMLFFVLTSVIAFVYAWRKGIFRYD